MRTCDEVIRSPNAAVGGSVSGEGRTDATSNRGGVWAWGVLAAASRTIRARTRVVIVGYRRAYSTARGSEMFNGVRELTRRKTMDNPVSTEPGDDAMKGF